MRNKTEPNYWITSLWFVGGFFVGILVLCLMFGTKEALSVAAIVRMAISMLTGFVGYILFRKK